MCEQVCWDCKKATGGCSWVDDFKPIEGWDARPTVVDDMEQSFEIKSCPEFEEDDIKLISLKELGLLLKLDSTYINMYLKGKYKNKKFANKYQERLKTLGFKVIVYKDDEKKYCHYGIEKLTPQFEILKTG